MKAILLHVLEKKSQIELLLGSNVENWRSAADQVSHIDAMVRLGPCWVPHFLLYRDACCWSIVLLNVTNVQTDLPACTAA